MSTSMESIDVDYLISLIQEREILWDKSHDNFKNKNLKAKAWDEVTKNLFSEYDTYSPDKKNKIGNTVMKKWRNVKDAFYKYLKKKKEGSRSGSASNNLSKYHYYNQLLFLTKVAQNATDGSLDVPEESNILSMSSTSDDNIIAESSRYVPVNRKRKAAQMDDFEKETFKALMEPENRHMNFFKGLLPSIEDFTDLQTLTFQSKVLQIITDIRYGQSSSYQHEEPSSHPGYQTQNYQTTSSFSAVKSNSNFTPSPNQVSQDSDQTEFDFNF